MSFIIDKDAVLKRLLSELDSYYLTHEEPPQHLKDAMEKGKIASNSHIPEETQAMLLVLIDSIKKAFDEIPTELTGGYLQARHSMGLR